MPNILAIETATSSCAVALRINQEIITLSEVGSNIHSQVLLSMVQTLLAQANISVSELDAIAVGQGPGSFTGLRIGVGVGQGLAFGADCPMLGVSSLDSLALQAQGEGLVIAGIDARMGEIYWCQYQKNGGEIKPLSSLQVSAPEQIQLVDISALNESGFSQNSANVMLVGNAWSEYKDKLPSELLSQAELQEDVVYPSARALLVLAEQKFNENELISAIDFAPVYVRDDVAKKSKKSLF